MKQNQKPEREVLEEINEKLTKILFAISLQNKNRETQLKILRSNNFEQGSISEITGLTIDQIKSAKRKK
jgi:hypothetical protein